jgi:murein DD-endopeptidase MepM/ murein hydrolase activator NlpD
LALVTSALLLLASVAGLYGLLARPAPTSPSLLDVAAVPPQASPSVGAGEDATADAGAPDQTPATLIPSPDASSPAVTPRPTPTSAARATIAPTPSRDPRGAPRNAAEFDLGDEAIEILFPLGAESRYWYRDNFMRRRAGDPVGHNHARVSSDGRMVRLHDGIDIYGPPGEPIVAPFSGQVIDPQTRWQPWSPERYGMTVVVVSDEPLTAGYAAVMVHLDRAIVRVGDRVERGDVIGSLGASGNADGDGIHPHLHFELRAPFALDWSDVGEERSVDAFNPFPSLVRADPQR